MLARVARSAKICLMRCFAVALAFLALAHGARAADHPSAPFTNELIEARVYLPDPENGYYRVETVGEPGEFAGPLGHIRGAVLVPLGELAARAKEQCHGGVSKG